MNTLRKVLVVDDDPAVRKSFDRVLSSQGYAVITAENGEEALAPSSTRALNLRKPVKSDGSTLNRRCSWHSGR